MVDELYYHSIKSIISHNPAISRVAIAMKLMSEIGPGIFNYGRFNDTLINLQTDLQIFAISITSAKTKGLILYFPKGTNLELYRIN